MSKKRYFNLVQVKETIEEKDARARESDRARERDSETARQHDRRECG